jgi:calcineurin-like phosphoesterase family protein
MSNVLFLGDLHAGHKAIAKYRTEFRDEQDHFEFMEGQYHKRVTKRDKCFFMGDAVFSKERLDQIAKWPGQKVLICGNHDTENISMRELTEVFDVHALMKYKEFWLSHAPMHTIELRGKCNIHGHVHQFTVPDKRYFNTSLENIGFELISLHEIRVIMEKRNRHYDEYGYVNVDWDKKEFKREKL